MSFIKEFFGIGGYQREPEGYLSWHHLLFVTSFIAVMIAAAIFFGRRYRNSDEKIKNRVLIVCTALLWSLEIFKSLFFSIAFDNPTYILKNLPLFFCSLQTIAIPIAAFARGIVKDTALDFIFVFGVLGAFFGTYFAGNNFGSYPVVCVDNTISVLTHTIAGFASLFIVISGMQRMKKRNILPNLAMITSFAIIAYIVGVLVPYNYMFLFSHDGTPYEMFYNLVNGNKVLYPMVVVALFYFYILVFYGVYFLITKQIEKRKSNKA